MKFSFTNFEPETIHSFAYGEKKDIASKDPCLCDRLIALSDLRTNPAGDIYEITAA